MSNTFIQEAFRKVYLTEDAEEFSLNVSGPDDTESFLDVINADEDDELISDVYDLEAEAKEDLKQSYIGKVILDCNVCHSNVFFDKDQITENEEGVCCQELECPYCMSNEGYTIIGEVKPYQEEDEVDIEDVETAEVPDEEPVDDVEIDVEETEEEPEAEEDELEEGLGAIDLAKGAIKGMANEITEEKEEELEEGLKADEVKELRGNEDINGADGPLKATLEGSDEIRGPKYSELNEGWMPINKLSRYFNVADEFQVNDKFEIRNAKTGKIRSFSTNNGGDADDKVTVKTKDGKTTSVAKETLISEIDNLRSENLGKSPFTINDSLEECGDPEMMEEGVLGTIGGGIAGAAIGSQLGHPFIGAGIGALAGNAIQNSFDDDKNESLEECGVQDSEEEIDEGVAGWAAGRAAGQAAGTAIGAAAGPAGAAVGRVVGGMIGGKLGSAAQDKLSEDIEDVSITTNDETMTMTTKEDGGVVVETSPKDEEEFEEPLSDEEVIAPIEPETEVDVETAIENNDEDKEEEVPEDEMIIEEPSEDEEDEFEEFDEESFDNLGESYLKRCYENVTSFKTSNITLNENKEFIIDGKIGFDSGNKKDTQFIFAKKSSDDGKLKLEGYNKQISNGKKTFKLNCSVNNKALICESLNYNYKGKNELNESVRVYGTVKRK